MISRAHRFHGHKAVSSVRGDVIHGRVLSLRFRKNKQQDYRLAVVVSKKTASTAVVRNRIRRRIFEAVRVSGRVNLTPIDMVIYVKTNALAEVSSTELNEEIISIIKKALKRLPK